MKKQLLSLLLICFLLIAATSMGFSARPTPEWKLGEPLPAEREGHAGGRIGNMIYITQGFHGGDIDTTIAYDINNDEWITGLATAPSARAELASVTHGGLLYTIGGRTNLDNLEVYNPVKDEWAILPDMPTGRAGLGAAVVGGKIYAIGGRVNGGSPHSGVPQNIVEVYNIAHGVWMEDEYATMPTARMDIYSTVAHGGKIYVIGGYDGSNVLDTVEVYNPAKDEWDTLTPMTTPRSNLTATVRGNLIYVIGGINNSGDKLPTVEVYNIAKDEWRTAPCLIHPTAETVSYSHGYGIYVLGGGIFGDSDDQTQILKMRR